MAGPRPASAGSVCLAGLLLTLLLGLSGCATNPVTGRQDFVLMSEAQEIALGASSARQLARQYPPYADPALQDYVQSVGQRLAAASHRPGLSYRFTVVDSAEVNAFALPGGHVYITRGLLALLGSEAELAAVLGHEIGHVTARHGVRQHSVSQATGITAALGAVFFPELASQSGQQLAGVLGTALVRGYGREQELEADALGAEYLARTGYDPEAMRSVLSTLKTQEELERQRAAGEGRPASVYHGLFATHPSSDQRIAEIITRARQMAAPGGGRLERERFLQALEGLPLGPNPARGVMRGDTFFYDDPRAGIDFALRFPAGWAVRNLPDRVLALAPGEAAALQLTTAPRRPGQSPKAFLTDTLGMGRLTAEGPIAPDGLEGYTAVAMPRGDGGQAMRFSVIHAGERAYVLAGAVRDPAAARQWDRLFLDTAASFHRLSAAERASLAPERITLLRAGEGLRFEALARGRPDEETRLRLLNGAYPAGEPVPGTLIKVPRRRPAITSGTAT